MSGRSFGWWQIARLGLVQAAMGAVVVMTTSTLNRVMVIELALPALLPGLLVAMHYFVQIARPRMGHGSDLGQRRTPWIIGGMLVLSLGGLLAAIATALMGTERGAGIALAVLAFVLIGIGVSASGTSLLVLLAARVEQQRRAGAATLVWLMMIAGFALTAGVAGHLLDPYPLRLIAVCGGVSAIAVAVTLLAIAGLEGAADGAGDDEPMVGARSGDAAQQRSSEAVPTSHTTTPAPSFREAVSQVWAEPVARRFTIFVFVSMLAFSAQDLILEPFAGLVLGFTPGQSTSLAGVQHGGMLVGMLLAALAGRGRRFGSLRSWQIGGCLMSALALLGLVCAGSVGPAWPFKPNVFLLGVSNGAFSIAAIASMMRLASEGRDRREGVRMGLWGAAQAVAFGAGGVIGTSASDLARRLIGDPAAAYATVFGFEALLFVGAAVLAARLGGQPLAGRSRSNNNNVARTTSLDAAMPSLRAR